MNYARGLIEEIHQSVRDGYQLHLVSSGGGIPKNGEAQVSLESFVSRWGGAPGSPIFSWHMEDIHYLWDRFYRKSLPTIEGSVHIEGVQNPYLAGNSSHHCWLFHANGVVLAELFKQHGEQLLQQNIRLNQGDTATNTSIFQACTGDDSENFLHYNNGVTFLSENASHDRLGNRFTMERAQIVNGGQTTRMLYKAYESDKLKPDVEVPIRVVTSQRDKDFGNRVTVNLNKQNKMKGSFLRSNDPIIRQLANSLMPLGWYLERREDEVSTLSQDEILEIEKRLNSPLKERVIPLTEGARAYVASFLQKVEIAKKFPRQMFDSTQDGGDFENIFNRDLEVENFILSYEIKKQVDKFIKEINGLKQRRAKSDNWKEYNGFFGRKLVNKHKENIDQITPSAAEFLCGVAFIQIDVMGRSYNDLLDELKNQDRTTLLASMNAILSCAKKHPTFTSQKWTPLFQSQTFFNSVVSHVRSTKKKLPDQ